ncbi:hypothetical protein, partial [Plasmodium yoelii yoelii]
NVSICINFLNTTNRTAITYEDLLFNNFTLFCLQTWTSSHY